MENEDFVLAIRDIVEELKVMNRYLGRIDEKLAMGINVGVDWWNNDKK
jgi:hypothetical protein